MSRLGMCALMVAITMSITACAETSTTVEKPTEAPSRDISGAYDVETARWYGSKFSSELRIRPLDADNRAWQLIDTSRPRQSVALQNGDMLGVAYAAQSRPSEFVNYFGVAIYEVDGTTLRGQWLSSTDPMIVSEETLSCPKEIVGECTVLAGRGPGGQVTEHRRIAIKRSHTGYWVNWSEDKSRDRIFGIGFVQGGKLIVAFGRDIFPVVQACRIHDASLECISSAGDFRYLDRASLTRRSST